MKKIFLILLFIIQLGYSQQVINTCEDSQTSTYIVNGLPNSTFSWNVNGGTIINNNNTSITVLWTDSNATYTITVVETSQFGCIGQPQTFTVTIRGCSFFYFPNSFTPNGDNINEIFNIEGYNLSSLQDYTLLIFNRWGQEIFTSSSVDKGWDGIYNQQLCKQDVYVYKCFFRKEGKNYEKIGQVNLIR
jgi:gliding motility-associated-like protein